MVKRKPTLTPFLGVLLLAGAADGEELVREFSGSSTTTTASFRVEAPWLLDWRLDGDTSFQVRGRYQQSIALDIVLLDAKSDLYVGRVKETKNVGNGLRMFDTGGEYKLRVSTTLGRWSIKIIQLTEEEAERYTPKNAGDDSGWIR